MLCTLILKKEEWHWSNSTHQKPTIPTWTGALIHGNLWERNKLFWILFATGSQRQSSLLVSGRSVATLQDPAGMRLARCGGTTAGNVSPDFLQPSPSQPRCACEGQVASPIPPFDLESERCLLVNGSWRKCYRLAIICLLAGRVRFQSRKRNKPVFKSVLPVHPHCGERRQSPTSLVPSLQNENSQQLPKSMCLKDTPDNIYQAPSAVPGMFQKPKAIAAPAPAPNPAPLLSWF